MEKLKVLFSAKNIPANSYPQKLVERQIVHRRIIASAYFPLIVQCVTASASFFARVPFFGAYLIF